MTTCTIPESTWSDVPLNRDLAGALEQAGQRLASNASWWGAPDDEQDSGSLIRCRQRTGGDWQVRVHDAVGVITVADLQLVVQPKIAMPHFIYLLKLTDEFPRHDRGPGTLETAPDLWKLVARWYVNELQRITRLGLVRDYHRTTAELAFARGSIRPRESVLAYYAGRPALTCDYDDFGIDTPANRVLRTAAQVVVSAPALDWEIRRQARSMAEALRDAGELKPGDVHSAQHSRDRRLDHYRPGLNLAAHVLSRTGRTLVAGQHTVWTFLIRTPGAIENAIRNLLVRELGSHVVGSTGRRTVAGVSFNPDIVFPGNAIADVKYKLAGPYWDRSDLYQSIAFATAFEVHYGAVFNFAPVGHRLPDATPGNLRIRHIPWIEDDEPETAANDFTHRVEDWLASTTPHSTESLELS